MSRDTYKYHFKQGGRLVYSGITTDLNKREQDDPRGRSEMGRRADETREPYENERDTQDCLKTFPRLKR